MSDQRPIGVLDSGCGGLTVLRELMRYLPGERFIYLGDTARFPYGTRSDATITAFTLQGVHELLSHDVKMIVVACCTMASIALDAVRKVVGEMPVIGPIVPVCRTAVNRSASRRIGIIGSTATIRSKSYEMGIHAIDPTITLYARDTSLLVPFVENGVTEGAVIRLLAQEYLYELTDTGIDCLVLACSHYPILYGIIQETVSSSVEIIDTASWTAREASGVLAALNGKTAVPAPPESRCRFLFTDTAPLMPAKIRRFYGSDILNLETVTL